MKKVFLFGLAASMLLTTASCNKEDAGANNEKTAMTISLVSEPGARATTAVTETQENEIKSMMVMVFDKGNGVLEKKHEITGTTGKITDVKTGSKKVVVVANPSAALKIQLNAVTSYADFNDPDKVNLELVSQFLSPTDGSMNTAAGLTMTGEKEAMLSAGVDNKVDLTIKRVVAKVKLGSITIDADPAYDKTKFVLQKVLIMKARNKSLLGHNNVLINEVSPAKFDYLGGMAFGSVVLDARLSGDAVEGANDDYFYVLPNNNNTGNCTLMTIQGTYDGATQYFVFRINDKEVPGAAGSGRYIERNHSYTVNVTLKRLGDGSDDPVTPSDPATLDVTVTPENWTVVPVQNVTW